MRRSCRLFLGPIGCLVWLLGVLAGCRSSDPESSAAPVTNRSIRFGVGASANQISDGETVRILAVYTDSTGASELRRGELRSPDGTFHYGDFVPLGDGSFIYELSWKALQQAAPIWFAVEAQRTVRAIMTDSLRNTLIRDIPLRLYCRTAGSTACGGACLPIGGDCGATAPGAVCLSGYCVPGCYVQPVYYPTLSINSAQTCQICDPTASVSVWSTRPNGTSCAVNSTCAWGKCVDGSLKIPTGISDDFNAVWGSGPGDIYATTTSGLILHTTDGWATIQDLTPPGATGALRGVSGTGVNQVVAVGNMGTIYRTTSSGTSWTQPPSEMTNTLYAVWGIDGTFYTVGNRGTILKSSDGGQTWFAQDPPTNEPLRGVWGSDANLVIAVGDNGTIVRTTDGGVTWTAASPGVATTFFAVTATDAYTYYAAGSNAVVLRSDDAGQTWKTLTSLGVIGNARSLWGSKHDGIYVGISNGTLWHSLDRGGTWSGVPTGGATNSWYGIWGTPGGQAWAVGASGSVIRLQ